MINKEKQKIDFKFNMKIYWEILKPYFWAFLLLLAIVLFIEAGGVAEKYMFKVLIDDGTSFVAGTLKKDDFIGICLIIGGIFAGLLLMKTVAKWLRTHIVVKIESFMIMNLKKKFFNHIIGLSHNFHTTHKTGSLISRMSRGGRAVEKMTDTIAFNFAPLIFQFGAAAFSLLLLDALSLVIVFIVMIVFIIFNLIFQQIQQKSNIEANDADDFEKANIGDIFTNTDAIKYFGKESFIKNRFAKISEFARRSALKNWYLFRWLDAGQYIILGLGTIFLVYFSLIKFFNGEMSLGTLVFIYTVYTGLMSPLFSFVHGLRDYYKVMADFNSLFQYAKIENEIKDKLGAKKMELRNGEIEFKKVAFNYGHRKIFRDLNLKINKNEKIALVGHSGCGKTTLIKLLYRFYDVSSGAVLIDGKDVREFKQESLRGEMGVVPQECVLFDDTVYNNVLFSKPNASREEVMRAIRFAQLDKIIKKFPNKEDTIVGERGVKLSGGEKQRVSIARAILANKKILILDEATSSLDSETEHEIQKDFEKLMLGRTNIIIAHRLSTIMRADRIIVMKSGEIVQVGKHRDLIEQPGEYKKLWNLQKGGYMK